MYFSELACVQTYTDEVPCVISKKNRNLKLLNLHQLVVGLYNIQLIFNNGLTFTIPVDYIKNAINKNNMVLKNIEDDRLVKDILKYNRYKGKYFLNYVKENNIMEWTSSYCSVCGHPVKFIFKEDKVLIKNECCCGNFQLNITEMSYDGFAVWYFSQTNEYVKKVYKKFWFKRGS